MIRHEGPRIYRKNFSFPGSTHRKLSWPSWIHSSQGQVTGVLALKESTQEVGVTVFVLPSFTQIRSRRHRVPEVHSRRIQNLKLQPHRHRVPLVSLHFPLLDEFCPLIKRINLARSLDVVFDLPRSLRRSDPLSHHELECRDPGTSTSPAKTTMNECDGVWGIAMELKGFSELIHRLGGEIDNGEPEVPDVGFSEEFFFIGVILVLVEADDAVYFLIDEELDGAGGQFTAPTTGVVRA